MTPFWYVPPSLPKNLNPTTNNSRRTATGLVPAKLMEEKLGIVSQGPEVIANAVALLMADTERDAQTIFSKRGKHKEVDKMLLGTVHSFVEQGEGDGPREERSQKEFMAMMERLAIKS